MPNIKKTLDEKTAFELRIERLEKHYETANKNIVLLLEMVQITNNILTGTDVEGSGLTRKTNQNTLKIQDLENKLVSINLKLENISLQLKIISFVGGATIVALIGIIFKFIFQ